MIKNLVNNIFEISFFLLIGKCINILSGLIIIPLLLNSVGAEGYGLIVLVASFMTYLKFTNLGMTGAIKIQISKLMHLSDLKKINELLSCVQFFYLFLFSINLFILLIIYIFNPSLFLIIVKNFTNPSIIPIVFIFLSIQVMFNSYIRNIYVNSFHGIDKLNKLTFFEVIYNSIYYILYIFFLLTSPDLILISIFLLVNSFIYSLITIFFFKIHLPSFKLILNFNFSKSFKSISNLSFWFFLTSLVSSLIFVLDNLLISSLYSVSALGIYILSKKIFELPVSIFPIAHSSYPKIQKIYNSNNNNELISISKYVLRLNVISKVGLILPITIFSNEIFSIWLGNDYYPGFAVIALLFLIFSTYTLTGICSILIQASEKVNLIFYPSIIELLIIGFFSIIFFYFFYQNLISFALALLISRLFNLYYMNKISKEIINISLINNFLKNFIPLLTIFIIFVFAKHLITFYFDYVSYYLFALSLIVYFFLFYFMILKKYERINIINFFRIKVSMLKKYEK
jgi:O-antigen/teichoic acid export membrane protein